MEDIDGLGSAAAVEGGTAAAGSHQQSRHVRSSNEYHEKARKEKHSSEKAKRPGTQRRAEEVLVREEGQQPQAENERCSFSRNPDFVLEKIDKKVVSQLVDMGFSQLRAEKAAYKVATGAATTAVGAVRPGFSSAETEVRANTETEAAEDQAATSSHSSSYCLSSGHQDEEGGKAEVVARVHPTKDTALLLESALQWLQAHEDDLDVDAPLTERDRILEKAPLSEEEAQRKAYELQKRLREERLEREKKEATEREKLRLAQTKAMLDQSAKLEEEQRKRQLAFLKKEKEEHRKERERQRQLLRAEYRERFGCEMPEEETVEVASRIEKMSSKEKVAFWCGELMKKYKLSHKDQLRSCFSTLRVYCANVRDNPLEPKFRKIRKQNNAFQTRVLPLDGALQLLAVCGFEDKGDYLEMSGQPDGFTLSQLLKFVDVILPQLK